MSEETVDPVALKKARFEKDPDSFIAVEDVIMAAIRRDDGGISTVHGGRRGEMEIGIIRLAYKTFKIWLSMDAENERRSAEKEIVIVGSHNGAPLHGRAR